MLLRNVSARLRHGEDFYRYAHVHNCTALKMTACAAPAPVILMIRAILRHWEKVFCNHIQILYQSKQHHIKLTDKKVSSFAIIQKIVTRLLHNYSASKGKVFTSIRKHLDNNWRKKKENFLRLMKYWIWLINHYLFSQVS